MKGILANNKVIISEFDSKEINNKIGEIIQDKLELSLVEGLYLIDAGKLEFNREEFLIYAEKQENKFYIKYSVFRDLRNRGYIVKSGFKYGSDFRIYPRGANIDDTHASHVVFCFADGEQIEAAHLSAMVRVSNSVRKKLMIGVVDKDSSCTYYELTWIKP